jgi:hypothetical protein
MNLRSKLLLFLLLGAWNASAQSNALLPHHESRPYFQLERYPQGYDKDSMLMIFNFLDAQHKINWKHKDSLDFFFALAATEEFDDALAFKKRIRNFLPRSQEELHLTQYVYAYKRRYDRHRFWLEYERQNFSLSVAHIPYRQRIHDVEDLILSKQWRTEDSLVFPELFEQKWKGMSKGSEEYLGELIPLVERIDRALRDETKYEFSSNVALALAFYEFGMFLQKHVSTTDAFIALSIAKYYDRFNPDINERYRQLRSAMNDKRLIFPSMRYMFPKQSKGFFNVESIMKRRLAKQDTLDLRVKNPEALLLAEVKNRSIIDGIGSFWIVFSGMVLLLFFVIFFVRVKH